MAQQNYIELVREALNAEYDIDLQWEVSLPKGRSFNFDLGDLKNKVVVTVHPSSKSFEVEFVSNEIAPSASEAVAIFGPKVRYFYVFEESLYSNDISQLEDSITLNQDVNIIILDGSYVEDYFTSKVESENPVIKKSTKNFQQSPSSEGIEDNFESLEKDPEDHSARRNVIKEWLLTLEAQKRSFYVATSFWNDEDHTNEFLTMGSWFHASSLALPLIDEVEIGSIIFLRGEEDASVREDQLGIKSVGIVTANALDGKNLTVNWILPNLLYHFDALQNYKRHAIDFVTESDLETILAYFTEEHFKILKESFESATVIPFTPTIAGLLSDADIGTDYLNITKDVSAFARVMAARSFLPPLAIALFGKWGSGKSFFMRKLRDEIDKLAINEKGGPFCRGIGQIHFNAWSYMDSNLWASMVSRIFEGLQQYISNDTRAKQEKNKIEETLTNKLSIVNEGLEKLKLDKETVDKEIELLEDKKVTEEADLENTLKKLRNDTLVAAINQVDEEFDVEAKIKNATSGNSSIQTNIEQLRKVVPLKYWKTADGFYEESKSVSSFLKVFFKKGTWWKNILWLLLIIAIILSLPFLVNELSDLIFNTDFVLSPEFWSVITIAGSLLVRGIKTYEKMQPAIAAFWGIKTDYDNKKEVATLSYHERQRLMTIKIEEHRNELATIAIDIAQKTHKQGDLEYRLENTLSTEALYSFIERKSESKSYSKHLGIVSTIRKDFEVMSELFIDHKEEVRKVDSKEAEKFRGLFERPLERIVLYIDDLDRCTEERVVEVLEAVNLLMAFPLFVVVVGVDPRWVKNALYKRHQLQFADVDDEDDVDLISPSAYLEKIFQVPFNLKSASDRSVKYMLKSLAETEPVIEKPKESKVVEIIPSEPPPGDNGKNPKDKPVGDKPEKPIGMPGDPPIQVPEIVDEPRPDIKMVVASLSFTEDEVQIIQEMSPIVGSSPRAIKRFVNIFRIVKAHEDYPNDLPNTETNAVLFLLALPLGKYKNYYGRFIEYINKERSELIELSEFLDFVKEDSKPLELDFARDVFDLFKDDKTGDITATFSDFKKHYPLIKRFSYISD